MTRPVNGTEISGNESPWDKKVNTRHSSFFFFFFFLRNCGPLWNAKKKKKMTRTSPREVVYYPAEVYGLLCCHVLQGQWYGCWRQVHVVLVHSGLELRAAPVSHQPLSPDSLQTPHPGPGRAPAAFGLQLLSQPLPLQQRWLIVVSQCFLRTFALSNNWIRQFPILNSAL